MRTESARSRRGERDKIASPLSVLLPSCGDGKRSRPASHRGREPRRDLRHESRAKQPFLLRCPRRSGGADAVQRRPLSISGRMAILAIGSHILDLFEHSANGGEQFEPTRTGLDHIGLTANSSDELRSWARWLEGCDVPRSAIREVENDMGALFDFVDPDGIQLECLFIDVGKLPPKAPTELRLSHAGARACAKCTQDTACPCADTHARGSTAAISWR
jgi:hypothetical protein